MKLKNLVIALFAAALIIPAALSAQGVAKEAAKEEAPAPEAAKINPYVILKLWAGAEQKSKDWNNTTAATFAPESDLDATLEKPAIIFLGFDVEKNGVKGKLEIGMPTPVDDGNNNLYLRHAYFTYMFGDVELLMGQTATPYTVTSTQQAKGDFLQLGFGASYDARLPQIKATYKGAYLAIISPSADATGISSPTVLTDVLMPKTAVGYNYKGKAGETTEYTFGIGAAGNMVQLDTTPAAAAPGDLALNGEKIISYLGYMNFAVKANGVFATLNATYGQNTGNFGMSHAGVLVAAPQLADKAVTFGTGAATEIKNTVVIEGFVELGYKAGKATISGSVGYLQAKTDVTGFKADQAIAYAGQCVYAVTDNFTIAPAVLYRDHMKNTAGVKQGTDIYAGIAFSGTFK